MSSFGFLNVSGIDGTGSGSGSGSTLPGGIDKSVQFNDGGLSFGGVSSFLFDKTTNVLTVPEIQASQAIIPTLTSNYTTPGVIIDNAFMVGSAGQVLSSNGGTSANLVWTDLPTPAVPGGPTNSIQVNSAGTFSGSSNFVIDSTSNIVNLNGNVSIGSVAVPTDRLVVAGTVRSTSSKPDTILDTLNTTGASGQVLSSTGTAIQWVNPPTGSTPGGSNSNIQFNSLGTFGGSNNFTYTDTTAHLKTSGLLSVGSTFTTVPRIFAQSGTAAVSSGAWDNQWIMAGGGSGAANSAGIGIGYNNTLSSGILACFQPSYGNRPLIYNAENHDFKCNGTTAMTLNNTAGGLLSLQLLQATNIRDGFSNTGSNGQFLSSTGTGLLWTTPAPYADSISNVGPFLTTAPTSSSIPTMAFVVPRAGRYRITTNVVTYPTGSNVTVTVETYWRQGGIVPYNLAFTSTSFQNSLNNHYAFPGKSGYVTLAAGSVQILIRTGANTGSGSVDPVNVDLLECSI